ncbi:MAG TPA: DMT family transporter [Gammaproteobacteria bacterium]|nr:DMT family transporter [Gammaproteobacteria bacterium]
MSPLRLFGLTAFAMTAFAANSLLCRLALKDGHADPASFTSLRLVSGALVLWLLVGSGGRRRVRGGDWASALALFAYAAAFSYAYISLPAGTGALLLFGAVQATMLLAGLRAGERLSATQGVGLALALFGLVFMLLPGLAAPPLLGAALMLAAGIAWGVYSLRGRKGADPAATTTGNFLRAAPFALAVSVLLLPRLHVDLTGTGYALASGALASGLGYVVWYAALKGLSATRAAVVQLSAPVIAAFGGVLLLGESVTPRLLVASVAILGGVALAVTKRRT